MKKLNLRYQDAHQVAERSEKVAVLAQGFDWEKYDAFMQTHIKRVMAQNKVNADLLDSSVIQRDANGKVTNLEEIIPSFQQKMAENIELFDKRLLPPGMNSDPLKVYADQSPTENDTSDQDLLVYAFTKASQQLYPERMAEDDYDHAPPEWITEITRPMLQR